MKVLIVDDDQNCLTALRLVLEHSYDCEVDAAATPEEALRLIYQNSMQWQPKLYDFILVDIRLPTMRGEVLTKVIRQTEKHLHNVPIIAMSGSVEPGDQARFKELGITEFLLKPVTKEKIDCCIKKYISDPSCSSSRT